MRAHIHSWKLYSTSIHQPSPKECASSSTLMDNAPSGGHSGRPIKRGRGAGNGTGSAFASSSRGRGGSAASNNSAFKRKLAGTPLFRPEEGSDAATGTSGEESGDDLPDLKDIIARKAAAKTGSSRGGSKLAKDDSLYDAGAEQARKTRFETVATENRYLQVRLRSAAAVHDRAEC